MLVMVGERMAVCTLAGFSDGAAVLVLTERQRGGPMPDFSPDAQLTFEYGPNLVMLNGTLQRGLSAKELLFSVSDGVQVPPRRRDTRLRARLSVTVRLPSGEERETYTADVSATGMGVEGTDLAEAGEELGVRLDAAGRHGRRGDDERRARHRERHRAEDRALRGGQPRPPGPLRPRPAPGVAGGRGARAARRRG